MKKNITITVTNDIATDNRMHKTAISLLNAGFNVKIIGMKKKNTPKFSRPYTTKLLKLFFYKTWLFYANYNIAVFFNLLFCKVDILLSVDLDSLLANYLVAKIRRKKLVYDSHELFTELPELVHRPKTKLFWQKIEKFILPKLKNSYTVCQSIANYYNQKYNIQMSVVRNVPFYSKFKSIVKNQNPKIIIYQGSLNKGRGIEEMIEAMQYLENYIFWIIGDGYLSDDLKKLAKHFQLEQKVVFIPKLPVEKLPYYTIQAHLGISFEKNISLNYYYALPNKIFDYVQASVPVLCSDLPEMKKIVEDFQVGEILVSHKPQQIAIQIQQIFNDEQKLSHWQKNLQIAKSQLIWENEQQILLQNFVD